MKGACGVFYRERLCGSGQGGSEQIWIGKGGKYYSKCAAFRELGHALKVNLYQRHHSLLWGAVFIAALCGI